MKDLYKSDLQLVTAEQYDGVNFIYIQNWLNSSRAYVVNYGDYIKLYFNHKELLVRVGDFVTLDEDTKEVSVWSEEVFKINFVLVK